MILAEQVDVGGDGLTQQRLRARDIAAPQQQQTELVLAGRRLTMVVAKQLPPDGQRLTGVRLGLRAAAAILQDPRQFNQRDRDILVLWTEPLTSQHETLLQQRLGASRI